MRLAARLDKLETVINAKRTDPYKEALEKDIRDWIINDPQAAELLKKEHKYCVSKGYPTLSMETLGFYEQLDDPVFEQMSNESMAALTKYLKGRPTV